MRKSGICAMAAASMACLALPVAADAKPAKKNYKEATFKATLSGSQVSIWEYNRPNDKDDPCDASAQGNGDQTIKFDAKRTFKVTFRTPPKGQPDLYSTAGRPTVFTTPYRVNLDATADRNGEVTVNTGDISKGQCGDNGGVGPDYVPPQPDCGKREGGFAADLYFHDPIQDEDELIVPLVGPEKNKLKLSGKDYEWFMPGGDGENSSSELRSTYERCPFYGEYPPDAGHIYISAAKIKESRLFNKREKRIVISGDTTSTENKDNTKTKTILAWNLRLKRVK